MTKKIFTLLFAVICLFSLAACEFIPENPGVSGGGENTQDTDKYQAELNEVLQDSIPETVSGDIEFVKEYEFEDGTFAEITWVSSNGRTLNKRGEYFQNLFDEVLTLTGNVVIYLDTTEFTYEYTKEVKTYGTEDLDEYIEIIRGYLPDYVYRDIELVERDGTFRSQNLFGNITYESTRPDVLTSEGMYVNEYKEDQEVEFCFTVDINGIIVKGSKIITVEGEKDNYYLDKASQYLDEFYADINNIYDYLELPTTDDNGRVSISWDTSDYFVISKDGKIQTFEPNKEATMIATITINDSKATWEKTFKTYNEGEMLDFIVNRMHRETIQQFLMGVYAYNAENLGYIPFYVQDTATEDLVLSHQVDSDGNEKTVYLTGKNNSSVKRSNIITGLIPWNATGRTQIPKTSTDFITIHDTGDAVNSAADWNEIESSGKDKRQTSWNFTIGDDAIYQHVPLDEVAWHAGDGSSRYGLNDTGVKYSGPDPEITLGNDGYIYINGQKSRIPIPKISGSTKTEYNGKYATHISPAGLYTCYGSNGNYYMASVHASNYSQNTLKFYVCTNGGNRNSIGIETCINKGVDYNQVLRNTANLVAHLLVYFDLDPSRVLTHRHFSGKLCPQVMIENNMLDNFHNVIENEYIIKKYLDGITFEYTSNNPDILANDGKILKKVTEVTEVSYSVKVTYGDQTKTYNLSTKILPR